MQIYMLGRENNMVGTGESVLFNLRAVACNFRELPDKIDISDFSIFCQEKPFGELLTKIAIKVSKEFLFLRNTEKCEMPCSCRRRH